jgi:uncharacterized oligopeptide transporter (OPT) family protein
MAAVAAEVESRPVPVTRDLTARAIAAGILIGAVQSVANVYMSLKTGIWDGGFPTASIVAFAVIAPWARRRGTPYTPHENLMTQAVAAAACAMPATAGLLGAIPAMELMHARPAALWVACWGVLLGLLGLAIGLPLRERLVTRAQLPFPTGRATSQVITAMRASGADALGRARALGLAGSLAMLWTWLRDGTPGWIPTALLVPGRVGATRLASLTLGLGMSPMMLGTGVLVGPHVAYSMLAGALLSWGVLGPRAIAWHEVASADFNGLTVWLVWPGVALMVAGAMTGLVLQLRALFATRRRGVPVAGDSTAITPPDTPTTAQGRPARLAPGLVRLGRVVWVTAGLGVVILAWRVFGVPPWIGAASVLILVVLADVVARAAGQTDFTPLGPMGQFTQAIAGPFVAGRASADVAAGGISGAVGQSATLAYMFRAGDDLGAPPVRVATAAVLGVFAGAAVCVPAYALIVHGYGLGTEAMPAAAARSWMTLAQVVTGGVGAPPHAQSLAWATAGLGVVLTLGARGRIAWLPSPVAMGVAFIIPAYYSVTIALGAMLWQVVRRWRAEAAERFATPAGSGAIAGEALAGVLIAALLSLGVIRSR